MKNLQVFDADCAALRGVAFDRDRGLIYVTEAEAGEWGETAVHVWQVTPIFIDGFESGDMSAWTAAVQ